MTFFRWLLFWVALLAAVSLAAAHGRHNFDASFLGDGDAPDTESVSDAAEKAPRQKPAFGNLRFGIDVKRGTFIKDGKPFRYIAGELHYFRIHPALWADRLMRVRHLGLNAIQVYVPWNYHEKIPGVIDFQTPERDLIRFLRLAHKYELYVLLRIGPYICSEWDGGGLPWWLLKTPGIGVRSSDERFLGPALRYLDAILALVADQLYASDSRGPILMLQIENEYGSAQICDNNYMISLRNHVRSRVGDDVVLYTTDGSQRSLLRCGTVDDVFATVDFGPLNNRSLVESSFQLQHEAAAMRVSGPNVNSEFYTTWFGMWGEVKMASQQVDVTIQTMEAMNALNASFSLYMVHGGTSLGFWSGAERVGPVLTSYDYAAPIDEAGNVTPLYLAIHDWIHKLPNWPQPPLDIPRNLTAVSIGKVRTWRLANLLHIVSHIIGDSQCVSVEVPLPFEAFAKPYYFMLHTTTLMDMHDWTLASGYDGSGGATAVLNAPTLHDIGYVFLDDEFQGVVSNLCHGFPNHPEWCTTALALNCSRPLAGRRLSILVEMTGRLSFPIDGKSFAKTRKGILDGGVTINDKRVTHWLQCGVDFQRLSPEALLFALARDGVSMQEARSAAADDAPAVYFGKFESEIEDWGESYTYFDATQGWSKGFVLVNGFHIGRYWSTVGPQMTLYVPGPIFRQNNTVIVVELTGRAKSPRRRTSVAASSATSTGAFATAAAENRRRRQQQQAGMAAAAPQINFIDHPIYRAVKPRTVTAP